VKWTQMVEAARGRHGVTSEDSDTERVVSVPTRHGPPKYRCLSQNYTNPHKENSKFERTKIFEGNYFLTCRSHKSNAKMWLVVYKP
jgi:hypothetical protein